MSNVLTPRGMGGTRPESGAGVGALSGQRLQRPPSCPLLAQTTPFLPPSRPNQPAAPHLSLSSCCLQAQPGRARPHPRLQRPLSSCLSVAAQPRPRVIRLAPHTRERRSTAPAAKGSSAPSRGRTRDRRRPTRRPRCCGARTASSTLAGRTASRCAVHSPGATWTLVLALLCGGRNGCLYASWHDCVKVWCFDSLAFVLLQDI